MEYMQNGAEELNIWYAAPMDVFVPVLQRVNTSMDKGKRGKEEELYIA